MADFGAIRPRMEVKSSDGEVIGHVYSSENGRLSVSPLDGVGAGSGFPVDPDWVTRVDEHVHLRHSAADIRGRWHGVDAQPAQQMGKAKVPWVIGLVLLAIAVLLLIWGMMYAGSDGGDTTRPIPATGQDAADTGG
ncbi:MAG TPA: DUF2171 domain-containing protein [Allosphingosinicella sp.]|jgi:hypothetical protein